MRFTERAKLRYLVIIKNIIINLLFSVQGKAGYW